MFLIEEPLTSKDKRERMATIMFETFNVPALVFATQSVLTLFGSSVVPGGTGVVIDCGHGGTTIVPIFGTPPPPHTHTHTRRMRGAGSARSKQASSAPQILLCVHKGGAAPGAVAGTRRRL